MPVASDIDNDSSLFYEVSPLGTSGAGRTQELPCAGSRVPQEPLHIMYLLPSESHPCEGSLKQLVERGGMPVRRHRFQVKSSSEAIPKNHSLYETVAGYVG